MVFRIFDHLLVHHGWSATGRVVVSDRPVQAAANASAGIRERESTVRKK